MDNLHEKIENLIVRCYKSGNYDIIIQLCETHKKLCEIDKKIKEYEEDEDEDDLVDISDLAPEFSRVFEENEPMSYDDYVNMKKSCGYDVIESLDHAWHEHPDFRHFLRVLNTLFRDQGQKAKEIMSHWIMGFNIRAFDKNQKE